MSEWNDAEARSISAGLAPLFQKARSEGLWFWCNYQDLWFSPDELESLHKERRFLWGVVNWKLRDPAEHVAELEKAVESAQKHLERFRSKVAG